METGYKVCDAMTKKPIIVNVGTTLEDCAIIMAKNHIGSLIVKDDEKLRGIITEQDIVRKTIAEGINPMDVKVEDIMVKEIETISPEDDIYDALVKMRDLNIRHLPVMDEDEMVGFLTLKDVLKIQPQLFDLMVEKFEIREVSRKLGSKEDEGVCQGCGVYSDSLEEVDNTLLCEECRQNNEG